MQGLTRRTINRALAFGAGLSLAGCFRSSDSGSPAGGPAIDPALLPMKYAGHNVILVSFDALQAAHVGAWGYPRNVTPTIDSVARDGVAFLKTYSVASWTVPASMTWFTGVYPSEHRMTNKFAVYNSQVQKPANLKELAPELTTLAAALRQHGYATGGFTGNAGVSGGFGYDQGFDKYFFEKEKFGSLDYSVPHALAWLRENKRRKFFLFLHGYDVHGQSTPSGGFDYRFVERSYDGKYTGSEQEQELLREEGLVRGRLTLREQDVRFWRAIYDEKIQRADAKFARFLRELDRLGLTENTLLVLTSDHGTEFYEHRRFDHGFTLYNEQIHVPLIVRLPGQRGGLQIADAVSSIDVMPTILDLLDVPLGQRLSRQLRGTSLVWTMRGQHTPRDLFSETDYREYTYKRSIIGPDGWKLIVTLESGHRELYHLPSDPGEAHDLASSQPERAAEVEERLLAHYRSIGHDLTSRSWNVGLNPVYPSQGRLDYRP
jgi:arylsulfatase A-like enzyme